MIKNAKKGRPIDTTKSDQILDAAAMLFMQKGFHATSMDDIARAASMSKLTLYRRFEDKNALFVAVMERKCHQHIPDSIFDIFDTAPLDQALEIVGYGFFSLLLSEDAIAMHRMMANEAMHNPQLTQLFYDTGPKRVKALLLDKMMDLNIPDPTWARDVFLSLFTGSDLFLRTLMNIAPAPTDADIRAHVIKVRDFFMQGMM
jgi:TetR/AcrR family transcriptional repressor of mexJK operon